MANSSTLLAFAEDPAAFVRIGPDEDRIGTDRAVVTFGPGNHFWSTHVARVRFGADDVVSTVNELHSLMRARGRRAAAWSIGPSATPRDVAGRLSELGLQRESAAGSSIMLLTDEPKVQPATFQARTVATFEEHLAAIQVTNEGFAFSDEDADDEFRRATETFEAERSGEHTARLLVFDGDRPVATGRAWFAPQGVYLAGGTTLPSHRRRGAMGSLVALAWTEAVRRGTPALATFGGEMSAPPLARLGFRTLGRLDHLIDRFGQ